MLQLCNIKQCHQVGDRPAASSGCNREVIFTYFMYCRLVAHCTPTTINSLDLHDSGEVTFEKAEHSHTIKP